MIESNPPGPSVAAEADQRDGLPLAPSEGWLALVALLAVMLSVGFAIDDSAWAGQVRGSRVNQTHFLPLAMAISVLVGFGLAKINLGRVKSHFVGAALGAGLLLLWVSSVISSSPSLEVRLRALNLSLDRFYHDAFELGIRSSETTVFLLLIGALLWAAGQFGAFAVFRDRRPMSALIVPGAILLANMAITVRDQYLHLVVFAAAALVLVVQLNLSGQRKGWRERRIVDGGQLSGLFMRSGAAFVVLTVVGSLVLAANASSAPLARAWRDADNRLLELGIEINHWIGGVSGAARGPSNFFTPSQTISEFWQASNEPVIAVATSDERGYYMRAMTYDTFDGGSWHQLGAETRPVGAGEELLSGTSDSVTDPATRREVTVTVTAIDVGGNQFLAPDTPYRVDRAIELRTQGAAGPFFSGRVEGDLEEGDTYTVSALVRRESGPEAVTASDLAAAGTRYPSWIDAYLDIRPDSISPLVEETADAIVAGLPADQRDPYHIADAIENYLWQDGGFRYESNVIGMCSGQNRVECFLRIKAGFCQHFASAMVMMLRTQDIPARYASGYLPGRQLADGTWRVEKSASHAWVEVYFPRHGWVAFDPTPGNTENGQQPTSLVVGDPVATPIPGAPGFVGRGEQECIDGFVCDDEGLPIVGPTPPSFEFIPSQRQPELLAPIALGLLILALAVVLVVAAARRIPQVQPEQAYRGVERIARRFGHGARPSQTAYEYAADLAEVVPSVRAELQVVATAKVLATYSPRGTEREVLERMRRAYRRVRIGLLRLILRRPRVGRSPRALGPEDGQRP